MSLNVALCIIVLSLTFVSLTEAQSCVLPNGGSSECARIHLCPFVFDRVKALRKPYSADTIAFLNSYACVPTYATVCCPSGTATTKAPTTLAPTTQATTTQASLPAEVVVKLPKEAVLGNNLPAPTNFASPSIFNHINMKLLNEKNCGQSNTFRIVGGTRTQIQEFPWMVLLRYADPFADNPFKCAGTLITKFTVLSAAHCLPKRDTIVSVRIGEYDLSSVLDCEFIDENEEVCAPPVQNIDVESIVPHPNYNTPKFSNDIMVIKLKTPADITQSNVETICLPVTPKMNEKSALKLMIITGWGRTAHLGNNSDVLLKAKIPFLNLKACELTFKNDTRTQSITVYDSHLCAQGVEKNSTDTCQGDSGGPIQAFGQIGNLQTRLIQYGVVSTGVICSQGKNYPGLYTDIGYYMRFILDNLK